VKRFWLALSVALALPAGGIRLHAQQGDAVDGLLRRLEQIAQAGDAEGYLGLLDGSADRDAAIEFGSTELLPGATRAVVQLGDRQPLDGATNGDGYRLMVQAFVEYGPRARLATWRIDVKRTGAAGAENEWTIADEERVSSVESIYRLTLNATKQYAAHDLKIAAEDLDLTLTEGSVFVAEIDAGATAVVLLGKGTLNFHPAPATEKGQVKIFCGNETLEARFDTAYIRLNPGDFESFFSESSLQAVPVDARTLKPKRLPDFLVDALALERS